MGCQLLFLGGWSFLGTASAKKALIRVCLPCMATSALPTGSGLGRERRLSFFSRDYPRVDDNTAIPMGPVSFCPLTNTCCLQPRTNTVCFLFFIPTSPLSTFVLEIVSRPGVVREEIAQPSIVPVRQRVLYPWTIERLHVQQLRWHFCPLLCFFF